MRPCVVYWSSVAGTTDRLVRSCRFEDMGVDAMRLPVKRGDQHVDVHGRPYVLIVPTYGGGAPGHAVPTAVKRFLNEPAQRAMIRGVIGTGNRNFGRWYAAAADEIARKCHVPILGRIELSGMPGDAEEIRERVGRALGIDVATRS